MTDEQRAQLLDNDLTQAVDEIVAAFGHTPAQRVALGNLMAAVLGRLTSLVASMIVSLFERIDRVDRRVDDLEERLSSLEAREAGRE